MRALAFLLDLLISCVSALVVVLLIWITATGGGVFVYQTVRISARSIDNPLLVLAVLLALRYWMRRAGPFLAVRRWPVEDVDEQARQFLARLESVLETITAKDASRAVLGLVAVAAAVKAAMAWTSPGFFSGDDVEVQEMSLRALRHTEWPVWDLRNATFPLGFVYPMQRLAAALGASDISTLIFAGRLCVAVLSSLGIWLIWRIGNRVWPRACGCALLAAFFLATSRLHMAFGATELPRPVSTLFVLGGFFALQSKFALSSPVAGFLIGIAACFRFSEAVFLVPAAMQLLLQRRWLRAAAMASVGVATMLIVLGLTDLWYWGRPFHSLRAALDYTLVERLSSRGYQSAIWYILQSPQWITPSILACALYSLYSAPGSWRRPPAEALWAFVPLVLLSMLPHKEARYAIPIVPFVCLAAVSGFRDVVRRQKWPAAVVAGLLLGVAYDVGHWRLTRTNSEVDAAQQIVRLVPAGEGIAVEQAWRMGGHLYLHPRLVIDLDPQLLGSANYFLQRTSGDPWVALASWNAALPMVEAELVSRGYRAVRLSGKSTYRLWEPPPRTR